MSSVEGRLAKRVKDGVISNPVESELCSASFPAGEGVGHSVGGRV